MRMKIRVEESLMNKISFDLGGLTLNQRLTVMDNIKKHLYHRPAVGDYRFKLRDEKLKVYDEEVLNFLYNKAIEANE